MPMAAERHSPSKADVAAGVRKEQRQPKAESATRMMDRKPCSPLNIGGADQGRAIRPGGRKPGAGAGAASEDHVRSLLRPSEHSGRTAPCTMKQRHSEHFTIRDGVPLMSSQGGPRRGYEQRPEASAAGPGFAQALPGERRGGRRHYSARKPQHTAGGNLHAPHILPAAAETTSALGTHVGKLLRDALSPTARGASERGASALLPAAYRLEAQSRPRGNPNPN